MKKIAIEWISKAMGLRLFGGFWKCKGSTYHKFWIDLAGDHFTNAGSVSQAWGIKSALEYRSLTTSARGISNHFRG